MKVEHPATLSIIILTFNEAIHIGRALASVERLNAKVFVVDSFSTDATADIARDGGAEVIEHIFTHQAQQFQWALDHLPLTTEWVMRLDADEELTQELVAELIERLPRLPQEVTGVNLKRRHVFLGRWIRYGGRYPVTLMRLWRKGTARVEQRWMDEHIVLLQGRSITFEHDFADINLNDVSHFTDKHNKYATREAIDVLQKKYHLTDDASMGSLPAQAARKRMIKEKIYNQLPLWMGPLLYLMFRYVIQRGFLDGTEGLIYHVLQGFWYRFLVNTKVFEFDKVLALGRDRDGRLEALERLTGQSLRPLSASPVV